MSEVLDLADSIHASLRGEILSKEECNQLLDRFAEWSKIVHGKLAMDHTPAGKPQTILVEVTKTELYYFPDSHSNGWSPIELLYNWFDKFPLAHRHAARDGARVGGSDKLIGYRIVDGKAVDHGLYTSIQRQA